MAENKSASPFAPLLSGRMGVSMVSFAQVASSSEGTATESVAAAPESGSISTTIASIQYEIFQNNTRSFFFNGVGSISTTSLDKYYAIGLGMNWYLNGAAALATFLDSGMKIQIVPKIRYYAGIDVLGRYLAYTTSTETRGDVGFEIGGHLGAIYGIDDIRGIKAEAGVFQGVGIETSSTNIQIMLGGTYFL